MSQRPNDPDVFTFLRSLQEKLEDGDPHDSLALLRVVRMRGLKDDVSAALVSAFASGPSDLDFQRGRSWVAEKLAASSSPADLSDPFADLEFVDVAGEPPNLAELSSPADQFDAFLSLDEGSFEEPADFEEFKEEDFFDNFDFDDEDDFQLENISSSESSGFRPNETFDGQDRTKQFDPHQLMELSSSLSDSKPEAEATPADDDGFSFDLDLERADVDEGSSSEEIPGIQERPTQASMSARELLNYDSAPFSADEFQFDSEPELGEVDDGQWFDEPSIPAVEEDSSPSSFDEGHFDFALGPEPSIPVDKHYGVSTPSPEAKRTTESEDDFDFDFGFEEDKRPEPIVEMAYVEPEGDAFFPPPLQAQISAPAPSVPDAEEEDDFFFPSPLQAQSSVPAPLVPDYGPVEDDSFFPPPLQAQSSVPASSEPDQKIELDEDDFFFPPPLQTQSAAPASSQPDEKIESEEDDFFFPSPLSGAEKKPSVPDYAPVEGDDFFPPPLNSALKEPSPRKSLGRQEMPTRRAIPSTEFRPQKATHKMEPLKRELKPTSPHKAIRPGDQKTPPRGNTPLPGDLTKGPFHQPLDDDEFLALGEELSMSGSSAIQEREEQRGPRYRGEPLIREVGDEPTPSQEAKLERRRPASEITNPFAERIPTGLGPEAGMQSSSFILEELHRPPSSPVNSPEQAINAALLEGRQLYDAANFTAALEIIEAVLEVVPDSEEAKNLRQLVVGELERSLRLKLGALSQTPTLRVPLGELANLNLDHRAGFLLSQIDGFLTLEDILDMSAMSSLETLSLLVELIGREIISL